MSFWQTISSTITSIVDGFFMVVHSAANDPRAWEGDIRKLEEKDRRTAPPEHPVVFAGSSSFTLWSSLEQDMAPLPALNRGFGGSRLRDVTYYVDRIITPYHPRAVVLFAGTNDVAGSHPASAQEVFKGYLAFVSRVRQDLPDVPVYFVSITPTPSRWKLWPIAYEANCLIEDYTRTGHNLHFIDLTPVLLNPDGRPDRSLYRFDRLHPNRKGYDCWLSVIKPVLLTALS